MGHIPKDWNILKLGDKETATIIMGQSPPSATYNTKNIGLPFLQGNADFGEIFPKPHSFTSKPIKIVKKNDILISVRAPVGEINLSTCECCIGRGLAAIRPNPQTLVFKYVYYYMKYKAKSFVGRGSTFKAIKQKDLKNFQILVPPLPEQKRIAEILWDIDTELGIEAQRKILTTELKKGLMQKLLRGKMRIK